MKNNLPGHQINLKDELVKKLVALDIDRKKAFYNIKKTWFFILLIIPLFFWVGFFCNFGVIVSWIFMTLVVLVLLLGLGLTIETSEKVIKSFKNNAIQETLKYLLPNVSYKPKGNMRHKIIRDSNLFKKKVNSNLGEDFFKGKRGNTNFELAEVFAQNRYKAKDKKGHDSVGYRLVFDGLFIVCDINLETTKEVKFFSKGVSGHSISKDMTKSISHNDKFDKLFDVYSYNKSDAQLLFNTGLINGLVDVQSLFNKKLYVSVIDGKVNVGIETIKNYFNPKFTKKIDLKQVERIYKEIVNCLLIVDVVDEINQAEIEKNNNSKIE